MKNLLTYIRSINFAVLICLLAMFSQAFHSFYSFWAVSSIKGIGGATQAMLFVVVFEFFTLFYLMRSRRGMAMFYATCLLVMNLYYYWTNLEGLQLALGIFLSIIIPVSIFNIAEEVAEDYNKSKEVDKERVPTDLELTVADFIPRASERFHKIEESIEVLKAAKLGRKKKTIPTPESLIKKGGRNE